MGKIKRLTPTERIEEVIDWLEHPDTHPDRVFSMDDWDNEIYAVEVKDGQEYDLNFYERPKWIEKNFCGSASCIAGTIVSFALERKEIKNVNYLYSDSAAQLLEFPDDKYAQLQSEMFLGFEWKNGRNTGRQRDLEKITPRMAAKMLRGYLKTGEVNWGNAPFNDF